MATLALGAVGAAVGYGIGGYAAIGWAVGSALGSYFFGPEGQDIEGPRLSDLSVQSSAYGAPKPETWGAMRQAGNVIWSTKIQETKHEEEVGGKGGGKGGATKTSYTYSISMAIAFGEGPIDGIRRIWANGDLIWTRADDADTAQISASVGGITVYLGDETQTADSTIEAVEGAGNVPAYRGTVYVVFDGLQLEDYGNRPPNIEAEIVRSGSVNPFQNRFTTAGESLPARTDRLLLSEGTVGVPVVEDRYGGTYDYPTVKEQGFARVDLYDLNGNFVGESEYPYNFKLYYGCYSYQIGTYQDSPLILDNPSANSTNHPFGNENYEWLRLGNSAENPTFPIGKKEVDGIVVSETDDFVLIEVAGESDFTAMLSGTVYSIAKNGCHLGSANRSGYTGASIYGDRLYLMGVSQDSIYQIWGFDSDFSSITFIEEGNISGGRPYARYARTDDGTSFYGIDTTNELICLQRGIFTKSDNALSTIVSDLCEDAGLAAADYDTSQLTDTVHGYTRTRSMTARKAIEPLQQAFWFDAVESDWQLQFVPRGASPVLTIPEDELSAHDPGSDMPPALEVVRKQEVELPKTVRISYKDHGADYVQNTQKASRIVTDSENIEDISLPIAMDNDRAAQAAEVMLNTVWKGRNTTRFLTGPKYAYLDPTDVISVASNGVTHDVRINRISDEGILTFEATEQGTADYTSSATGHAATAPQPGLTPRGPTRLVLLDIPILRDVDNDPGYYVAVNGYLDGWNGAVVYTSSDGGEVFNPMMSIFAGAVIGTTTDTLADGPTTIIDESNTVNVKMPLGELSSISDATLFDGETNAAAIGVDGRWEIIQFRDATLESDGTYTLSHLVRGKSGTEWAASQHASGDTFVLLTETAIRRKDMNVSAIGSKRLYKGVTVGAYPANASEVAFSNDAVGLYPYSPAHLKAIDNGDGTFDVSWVRRGRIGGEWRDYVDVPLGEDSEVYRVKVISGGTETSSTDVSSEAATVTAASGDTIKVAQISAIVGAGYYSEIVA